MFLQQPRLVVIAMQTVEAQQRAVRLVKIRAQCHRAPHRLLGLVDAADVLQQATEVVVGFGQRRLNADGFFIAGHGLRHLHQRGMAGALVAENGGSLVRHQRDGTAIQHNGPVVCIEACRQRGRGAYRHDMPRIEGQGLIKSVQRIPVTTRRLQQGR